MHILPDMSRLNWPKLGEATYVGRSDHAFCTAAICGQVQLTGSGVSLAELWGGLTFIACHSVCTKPCRGSFGTPFVGCLLECLGLVSSNCRNVSGSQGCLNSEDMLVRLAKVVLRCTR